MKPTHNGGLRPHKYQKHGLHRLKRAMKDLGNRAIDRRTTTGKALAQWRTDLIQDLGGKETISTQQAALVDLAVKSKLILDSIDAWLLTRPSLINARRRTLLPVVKERTQLADSLARYLNQLGLERKAKPVVSLDDYLESKYSEKDGTIEREEETNTDT